MGSNVPQTRLHPTDFQTSDIQPITFFLSKIGRGLPKIYILLRIGPQFFKHFLMSGLKDRIVPTSCGRRMHMYSPGMNSTLFQYHSKQYIALEIYDSRNHSIRVHIDHMHQRTGLRLFLSIS